MSDEDDADCAFSMRKGVKSEETNEISNISFGNCLVNVNKNYVYEELC